LTSELRKILSEQTSDGITRGARLMKRLEELGEGGDIQAIRTILERVDGKLTETPAQALPTFVLPTEWEELRVDSE